VLTVGSNRKEGEGKIGREPRERALLGLGEGSGLEPAAGLVHRDVVGPVDSHALAAAVDEALVDDLGGDAVQRERPKSTV
jgi:hypothetical protein